MYDKKLLDLYERLGLDLPSVEQHGTEEDVRRNLKSVNPRNWRLTGNKLIADTDVGPLVNYISTDYICRGTDENGLPILERIA